MEPPAPAPDARSWPRRPAASACARRRRASGADLVFLDLEDACAPSAKESARKIAVAALTELDWGRTVRAVRINGVDTVWCHDDIIEIVTGARERSTCSSCRRRARRATCGGSTCCSRSSRRSSGSTKRIGLEVLIEDAEGLANAVEIAGPATASRRSSSAPATCRRRMHARVDGNFDPVSEYPGDFWHFARVQVVTAARVAGIDAIDAPYPAYQDPDGYRRCGRRTPACWASTASGRSTRARSRSPTRCSRRRPRRSPRRAHQSRSTAPLRHKASARSEPTAGSSTPRTCASPPTSSTKPTSPKGQLTGSARVFVSRYSRRPGTPISRPMPDCL